jgi:hypothetical protein
MRSPSRKPTTYPYVTSLQPAEIATMTGALARVAIRAKTEKLRPAQRDALDYVVGDLSLRLKGASRRRRGLVTFVY